MKRVASATAAVRSTTHYKYDNAGRSAGSLATIGYNVRSERASLVRASGDNTHYTYDGIGRLASLTDAFAGVTGNNASTFAYNPASQVIRATRSNHAYAWSGHYNVDRPYAANRLNQYAGAGPTTFDHDKNGNLVRSAEGPRIVDYVYDIENRLVRATGSSTATLVYDPLGRLFQVSGGIAGPTQAVLQVDQTAPAHQKLLRHHPECGDDPDLDRRLRLRAYRDRQKAAVPRAQALDNPTVDQRHRVRKNAP